LFTNGEDVKIFHFLGRLLGKAMYEGITVEPQFAEFFLRKLIGKSNTLNDLKSLDEDFYKQLNFLKNYSEGPISDMMLTFCTADEDPVTG